MNLKSLLIIKFIKKNNKREKWIDIIPVAAHSLSFFPLCDAIITLNHDPYSIAYSTSTKAPIIFVILSVFQGKVNPSILQPPLRESPLYNNNNMPL